MEGIVDDVFEGGQRADQSPRVDVVEVFVRLVQPVQFVSIIDVKVDIWGNIGGLNRREVGGDYCRIGEVVGCSIVSVVAVGRMVLDTRLTISTSSTREDIEGKEHIENTP